MDFRVYSIPLRTRFRGIDEREGVLVHGPAGWGEFSPFLDYGPPVTSTWWQAAYEAAFQGWPEPVRDRIPVNVTVPAVGPERAARIVAESVGCRTAKVKVAEPGQSLAEDLERVAAVRDALGADGRIRVDANGGWDVDAAVPAIRALDRYDLEYVEQPCASLAELAAVRRRIDVPLAADESVRTATDPLRIAGLEAADIVVLKVQPLGGVRRALAVAQSCGLPVVVSSALETSVGIAAGLALAAALPELPFACGLATVQLLAADPCSDPLLPVDGYLPVGRPEPDRIGTVEADRSTRQRWEQRLAGAGAGQD
ncbi:MAG: o-succinylbenzoate synthase [Geodermatophilaceae bacterium]